MSVRRTRDGGEVRKRSDFSSDITALSLDDSRLMVLQDGLTFIELDDKMNAIFAYNDKFNRVRTTYPHSDFVFARKGEMVAGLLDSEDGIIRCFFFDRKDSTLMLINRGLKTPPPWAGPAHLNSRENEGFSGLATQKPNTLNRLAATEAWKKP